MHNSDKIFEKYNFKIENRHIILKKTVDKKGSYIYNNHVKIKHKGGEKYVYRSKSWNRCRSTHIHTHK